MAKQVQSDLDFNAGWMREMRARLGWSVTTAAERARDKAREFGDSIKLSQQLVSKLENGHFKSIPRWLGYMQLAMADDVIARGLPEGRLWKVKFPREIQNYFEELFHARNGERSGISRADGDSELTGDDLSDVELLNSLSPSQREIVRALMRSMTGGGTPTPGTTAAATSATLHSPSRSFAGSSQGKGQAA